MQLGEDSSYRFADYSVPAGVGVRVCVVVGQGRACGSCNLVSILVTIYWRSIWRG